MEELLIVIVQFFLELFLDVFVNYPFSDFGEFYEQPRGSSRFWRCVTFLSVGCLLGWLSVLLIHHSFLHTNPMRIANLIVAPVVSATIASKLASFGRADDWQKSLRYWQAFWFTLGFALVRFAYAGHG